MVQFRTEDIIFEDRSLLVCRKPIGMAVQSAKSGQMDLECALKNYLSSAQHQIPYLGIIHRLDQPVEGILVFAKTVKAAKELNRQMVSAEMGKYYLAAVCAAEVPAEGRLVDYLQKDGRTNSSRVVPEGTAGGKRAVLDYRCIRQETDKAILEVRLHTGRHHQIRVQLAHARMPLWGDYKYNPQPVPETTIGLCAYKLKIRHPMTKKEMNFEIEPENVVFRERSEIN